MVTGKFSLFSFISSHNGLIIASNFFTLSLFGGRTTFSRKMFGLSGLAFIMIGSLYWSSFPRFSIEVSVMVAVSDKCAAAGNRQVSSPSFLNLGRNSSPL